MSNRIYFSIPNSSDTVPQQFASSFAYGLAELVRKHPEVDFCVQDYLSNLSIAAARNREIHTAISMGADWLWFLDTDHRFPTGSFNRLFETALELKKTEKNFLEVSGLYYGRTGDHPPMGAFLEHPDLKELNAWEEARKRGSVIMSSTVPTGFTLIDIEKAKSLYNGLAIRGNDFYVLANKLMKKLANEKKCSESDIVRLNNLTVRAVGFSPALFIGQYTPLGALVTTEDYFFSRMAASEGYTCWIDLGCEIQHKIRDYWYPAHRDTEPIYAPPVGTSFVIRGKPHDGIVVEKEVEPLTFERAQDIKDKADAGLAKREFEGVPES